MTKFCVEPAEVTNAIRKVGGTKNPDVERIIGLNPELVLANREENNEEDVVALRKAGLNVYVGDVRTADEAKAEIENVARLVGGITLKIGDGLEEALEEQRHVQRLRPRVRAAALIWRNPYMAASGDTYIGDLLRVCGAINVLRGIDSRTVPATAAHRAARTGSGRDPAAFGAISISRASRGGTARPTGSVGSAAWARVPVRRSEPDLVGA